MQPETRDLKLGFIPLIDCAPLVVAREQGFFEAEGLNVRLSREVSWSNIRDKLCIGTLDGAHMLAPMPLAITLGLSGIPTPLVTSLSLSLNGNAITIAAALRDQLLALNPSALNTPRQSLQTLKYLIEDRRTQGLAPLTFAMVYPFSCHNYLLRYWLAAGDIDPDQDVNLIVIPPPQMAGQLASGRIDGLCVGEPWNQVASARGYGHILLNGYQIWQNAPEKVLAVRSDWVERNPATHQALLRALILASAWLGNEGHRKELAVMLGRPEYLDLPPETIVDGMQTGQHIFHQYCANYPWRSHAVWLLSQMIRWGQINQAINIQALAGEVYRSDCYRRASSSLSLPCPDIDSKTEGGHSEPRQVGSITLGSDRFIDDVRFDPARLREYLDAFRIDHGNVNHEQFDEADD